MFCLNNSPLRHLTRWCSECDWVGRESGEGDFSRCPECHQGLYPDRIITFGATEIYYWAVKDRFFLRHPSSKTIQNPPPHNYAEAEYYTMNYPVAIWHADLREAVLFMMKNSEEFKA